MSGIKVKDEIRVKMWETGESIMANNPRLNNQIRRIMGCIQNPMEIDENILTEFMHDTAYCIVDCFDIMSAADRKDLTALVNWMLKEFGQDCELRFTSLYPGLEIPQLYGTFLGVKYVGAKLEQFV